MIVVIILLVVVAIMIGMMLWSLITICYIDLHYAFQMKRIDEIYNENIKRINEGNFDDFISYNIIDKEPSPYWVVRVNQKLGLW